MSTADLEAERDYLLRSLDDLDAEHASGDLDDATYARLRDEYTARAAAVVRRLDAATVPAAAAASAPSARVGAGGDGAPEPDRPHADLAAPTAPTEPAAPPAKADPSRRKRRIVTAAVLAAFVVAAVVVLVLALRDREPGGTLTGNDPAEVSVEERREAFADAVARNPDSFDARMAYGRFLANVDVPEAIRQLDEAARLDPASAEPRAFAGWLMAQAAAAAEPGDGRDQLVTGALGRIDEAIALDPEYADSYFYKGWVLYRLRGDALGAVTPLAEYVNRAPDSPLVEQVQGLLAEAATEAGLSVTPDTTPTSAPAPAPGG